MTRGLPGAGKTERALRWVAEDPKRRARVGSDEVAAMLHPHAIADAAVYGPHYAEREQLVVHAVIEVLLRSEIDVVCDDPFLLPRYLDAIRELAERCNAELVIWDLTHVDVEQCIARDKRRGENGGRSIGEEAIRDQDRQYREHQQSPAFALRFAGTDGFRQDHLGNSVLTPPDDETSLDIAGRPSTVRDATADSCR